MLVLSRNIVWMAHAIRQGDITAAEAYAGMQRHDFPAGCTQREHVEISYACDEANRSYGCDLRPERFTNVGRTVQS